MIQFNKGDIKMHTKTIIAKNIQIADDKAKYDAACKSLLSEKMILAWIMKSCLEEYKNCEIQVIAEQYIEGTPQVANVAVLPNETKPSMIRGMNTEDSSITEETVTYDIRFCAIAPDSEGRTIQLIINVEAQNDFYPGYPLLKRGIYYCSRMISAQYGTEFMDSHYEKIKKVYSIWVCLNPPKYRENTINRYYIKEENIVGNVMEQREHYDLLNTVIICLGNENGKNYDGILKLLEVLLSSEKTSEQKIQILENDFQIPMTQNIERKVSQMCNLSQSVEEKGRFEGQQEERLSSIKNLMETTGWNIKQVMEALKISENEQQKYIDLLKL